MVASATSKRIEICFETPRSVNHFPAGPLAGNEPAGEMWSVVIESPSFSKTLAFSILLIGFGVSDKSVKNVGSRMYVDSSSHGYKGLARGNCVPKAWLRSSICISLSKHIRSCWKGRFAPLLLRAKYH